MCLSASSALAARTVDYNCSVHRRTLLLLLAALVLAGCDLRSTLPGAGTSTPFIITSTLPPTVVPSATLTAIPPTPSPTIVPVQGMTTTQVNVRGQPATAAPQLAILPPFVNVQIVARDADSNWYQILYPQGPDGKGWVSAQFINITSGKDTIPVIGGSSTSATQPAETPGAGTSGPTPNGVVIQQVNVRNGPGTSFDAIGTLQPKDTVTIVGKDPSGSWLQIDYSAGPDGKGWVAAGYVQATGIENLPIVGSSGATVGTGTPVSLPVILTPTPAAAFNDHDSAQAPAADVALSATGTRALIYSSDVSAPEGDTQDWLQFTTAVPGILLSLECTGNSGLGLQLTRGGASVSGWDGLKCGETREILLSLGQPYLLEISVSGGDAPLDYVAYTLKVEAAP